MPYRVQDDSVTLNGRGNPKYAGKSVTVRGEERRRRQGPEPGRHAGHAANCRAGSAACPASFKCSQNTSFCIGRSSGAGAVGIVRRRPVARLARVTDGVGLYLFCTWTPAFLRISRIGRLGSLRSLSNSTILVDQLPPPPPLSFSFSATYITCRQPGSHFHLH